MSNQPLNTNMDLWCLANQQLIARSLSELIYEQELVATRVGACYQVTLNQQNYQFSAKHSPWDHITIEPASLTRNGDAFADAPQFCLDLKKTLSIDELVLGNWLEDVQNTLFNEFQRLEKLSPYQASELLQLDEPTLQGLLDAHPKIIANRGRLGWGASDNQQFSPESLNQFQLEYIAAHHSILTTGHQGTLNNRQLMCSMMSEKEYDALLEQLSKRLLNTPYSSQDFTFIPCHPWQYQHKIRTQFQWAIQQGLLIPVGQTGDFYQPQQSIRTLSNRTRPEQYDIKLAITILNTSCYRGVPEKFIAAGYQISQWLNHLTHNDPLFQERSLRILTEPAGYYVSHRYQNQLTGSPYRYHEMLGCIWRDSAEATKTNASERHMLLSALLQKDVQGHAIVSALIESSELSAAQWLQQLFKVMAVPLYHLLVKYGVGVIAHGQNVVIYFDQSTPCAIAIKDFHGDLRLLDAELPEQEALSTEAQSLLNKLPKEHLVHDLLTGHFISVYRFLAPLIAGQTEITEEYFYCLLAEQIWNYQQSQSQYADRFEWFNLFRPKVERICLNNVRFKIGYQDNAERPLPSLGSDLENPIFRGLKQWQKKHTQNNNTKHSAAPFARTMQTTSPSSKENI